MEYLSDEIICRQVLIRFFFERDKKGDSLLFFLNKIIKGDTSEFVYVIIRGGCEIRVDVNSPSGLPLNKLIATIYDGDSCGDFTVKQQEEHV